MRVCVFSLKFLFWRRGGSRAGFLGALLVQLIGAHQNFLFTNLCHFNYYSLPILNECLMPKMIYFI